MKKAHDVKGHVRFAKISTRYFPKDTDSSTFYGELSIKIGHGDKRYFVIQNEAVCLKERPGSHEILHKIPLVDMKFVLFLSNINAICFQYLGDAWMLQALNQDQARLWANALLLLHEEAVKQHHGPSFPPFDVIEDHKSTFVDFMKDEADYSYLPLAFKKVRAITVKIFDTATMYFEEEEKEKKRERSVEILSDDD